MDSLTRVALVGTAQATTTDQTTGTPVDALVAALGDTERERALLLRAGALAIYREAGLVPARRTEPLPDPAPAESLVACSPGAADVVSVLLKHHPELLPEALDRLIAHGQRLPPELVPSVLGGRLSAELRPRLRRVLGVRGQWLARFNSAWAWAAEVPVAGEALPADAETLWQEGQPSQRVEVFARLRAADPARSREWFAATWRREKADMRADLLIALATNLTPEDEPFLEAALDDKVERVRDAAAAVLARMTTSAFVARLTARADAMLTGYTPGALHLANRITWAADFARDGLSNDPPRGTAKSDWLLQQVLGSVPPDHWVQRLGASPADLVIATVGNPYQAALVTGWSRAIRLHGGADWSAPLWDWWVQQDNVPYNSRDLRDAVLAQMPQAEMEARVLSLIDDGYAVWSQIIAAVPAPWSDAFAQGYLTRLLAYIENLAPDATTYDTNWPTSFSDAAHSMSPAALARLPAELVTPWEDRVNYQVEHWKRMWREMSEVAALRLRVVAEIGPVGA